MDEKRSEPRFALEDEVRLVAPGRSPELAQVMDVSAHGLRLRFPQDLGPGTPVKIRLDFLDSTHPDHTPILRGDVMHRFPEPGGTTWQIGIRLAFADPSQEAAFQKILETLVSSL